MNNYSINSGPTQTIGLVLIGGIHHILHLVPIASELCKLKDTSVIVFVKNQMEFDSCDNILRELGMLNPDIRILESNRVLRLISKKLAALFSNLSVLKNLDAIIVAEHTSTILRYLPLKLPVFIRTKHGAGDRAQPGDERLRHFDHVLVPGEKEKTRLLRRELVTEEICHITGYIKPTIIKRLNPDLPVLFDTERPIVLYCPHFSEELSSWPDYGMSLLEKFAEEQGINFIFAPHIRLFKEASAAVRAQLEKYGDHPNIHVDLGSERSTDMTYTRSADIYLGDVSSQVYEFLSTPKPCIFIGQKDIDWQNDINFMHWTFGPVCHNVSDVMSAIRTADDDHLQYQDIQASGCLRSLGDPSWNPVERAAKIIISILNK